MNYEIYWYNVNHLNAPRFTLIGYDSATARPVTLAGAYGVTPFWLGLFPVLDWAGV